MALNLFNSNHKATNKEYREGYERIFGKKTEKPSNDKNQKDETDLKEDLEKEI